MSFATFLKGLILGWSVSWPPGPVNAEMIRRGLRPAGQGGGFLSAWRVGLGACTGDFIWALSVAVGAGALLNRAAVRQTLGIISFTLLLGLAFLFARAALGAHRDLRAGLDAATGAPAKKERRGYWLGFFMALTSPFNIGFWLAVVGQQGTEGALTVGRALTFAAAVLTGALMWVIVLCTSLHFGARFFVRPAWQVWTQAITAGVMLFFAVRVAWRLWF